MCVEVNSKKNPSFCTIFRCICFIVPLKPIRLSTHTTLEFFVSHVTCHMSLLPALKKKKKKKKKKKRRRESRISVKKIRGAANCLSQKATELVFSFSRSIDRVVSDADSGS